MAMFPPSVPNYFINKYSKPGDTVFDPFSGRGTTAIEACFEGRRGIGSDRNPLAFVLTKAQTNVPSVGRILSRIAALQTEFESWTCDETFPWEINMIFHPKTLNQIAFLRKTLHWKTSNVDAFIMALLLGILHGGSKGYLSLPMPNTFSYSPNYIKKYAKKHGLIKPKRDTFALLRKKLERCYEVPQVRGKAYFADARKTGRISNESVDLIITSPPYTRLIAYAKFNWIRLWALKEEAREIERTLFTTSSQSRYYRFMREVISNCDRILTRKGKLILVIGDVQEKNKTEPPINLAEEVWVNCAQPLGFEKVEGTVVDPIRDDRKVTKVWGKTRGNATKIDRMLILSRK
jgi:site-specific DNA-methyltransferase (adenine-specific)